MCQLAIVMMSNDVTKTSALKQNTLLSNHAVAPSGGDAFNRTGQSLLSHMMAFMEHHHHHQHHVIHFMEQDSHNHQCIIHSSGPLFPGWEWRVKEKKRDEIKYSGHIPGKFPLKSFYAPFHWRHSGTFDSKISVNNPLKCSFCEFRWSNMHLYENIQRIWLRYSYWGSTVRKGKK